MQTEELLRPSRRRETGGVSPALQRTLEALGLAGLSRAGMATLLARGETS